MDIKGDQSWAEVMESKSFDSKDNIIDNSLNDCKEVLNEMTEKCEFIVNAFDDNESEDKLLRRADSDADIEFKTQTVSSSDDTTNETKTGIDGKLDDSEELIKVSVITTEPIDPIVDKDKKGTVGSTDPSIRIRNIKPKTEKWGESIGIVDENGSARRVIDSNELFNYLQLKSSRFLIDSNIYCSLINERYPRFLDSTIDYHQRWRMRYNIFADKVLADPTDQSLVHIGEIHLYFDLIPKFSIPYYMNESFHLNPLPAERDLNKKELEKVIKFLQSIRKSDDIFQLKFPIKGSLFRNTNEIFDKFMDRQHELVEEAQSVHRKFEQKRRYGYGQQRGQRGGRQLRPNSMRSDIRFERDFGPNNRDYHQSGGQFFKRSFRPNNRGMPLKDPELNDNQRNFDRNERAFNRGKGRGVGDSSRGMDRKARQFNSGFRRNQSVVDSGVDSEVMFEDTRERHEKFGNKSVLNKTNKGLNRFDHNNRQSDQQFDGFRAKSEPNYAHNYRTFSRRRNIGGMDVKDNHYMAQAYNSSQLTGALNNSENRRPDYALPYM